MRSYCKIGMRCRNNETDMLQHIPGVVVRMQRQLDKISPEVEESWSNLAGCEGDAIGALSGRLHRSSRGRLDA